MRGTALLAVAFVAAALVGCGSDTPPPEGKPKDPYEGMTKEQKIDAIRNDPRMNSMEREGKIAELQKSG